ncbi:hypothetical protein JHK87_027618 [Glycine soja]|nr:hypothetical protein JHK87_027618 [Glycine soja]
MSQMKGTPSFAIEALILSSNPMNAGSLQEQWKNDIRVLKHESKEQIILEMSQWGSPISKPIQPDIHVLGVRVSTKGSNAEAAVNPSLPNHAAPSKPTMGVLCHNGSPDFFQFTSVIVFSDFPSHHERSDLRAGFFVAVCVGVCRTRGSLLQDQEALGPWRPSRR